MSDRKKNGTLSRDLPEIDECVKTWFTRSANSTFAEHPLIVCSSGRRAANVVATRRCADAADTTGQQVQFNAAVETYVCASAVPSPSPGKPVTFGDRFGGRWIGQFGLVDDGSVPAMWSSVLGLALLSALHPVRLGLILLLISRPRPVQNLLAYWVGSLTVCVPALLIPLMVVHFTPIFRSVAQRPATPSSAIRHIQIGIGVVVLSIAALMTVRFVARQRAQMTTPGSNTSNRDSNTPIAIPWLLNRKQDAATERGSAVRRLIGRAHDAWENGSLWIAWVIGLGSVSIDGVLFVAAIIVASGTAIGTQVAAAIAFLVGMYAVVEIILVTYLATPTKTQEVLRLLHDWTRAHHRQLLIAIFTVVGVSQVAQGMGIV